MKIKIIVCLLSLSVLIMTLQTVGATQSLNSSFKENNTTLTKTMQDKENLNPLQKKLTHNTEILGPWTVQYNTSEDLSTEKMHIDGSESEALLGMNVEGLDLWGVSLIDNMSHEVGALIVIDLPRATTTNPEMMDDLIKSVLNEFNVNLPTNSGLEIDGTSGRQGVGYSSLYNRDIRVAAYPLKPYYDSFYSQNVSKSLVYYTDLNNENEFNEVISSLHVEPTSQ